MSSFKMLMSRALKSGLSGIFETIHQIQAIEFIFPMKETRQFTAAEITNQDLINRTVVLVNGVRIALNLAQVE